MRKGIKSAVLAALLVLLAGSARAGEAGGFLLEIVRHDDGRILKAFSTNGGDFFLIAYTHSSDGTPVRDTFQIDEAGRIVLREEAYRWYGAGLEFHPDAGARFVREDGWTKVLLERPLPCFLLRTGTVAGHVLTYREEKVPLQALAGTGRLLWIRTRPCGRPN
jgi:hypothetical protein